MAIKILARVGMKVPMNECPEEYWETRETTGIIKAVNRVENLVLVVMPNGKKVKFDLDGSSWSDCGEFKRDIPFVS